MGDFIGRHDSARAQQAALHTSVRAAPRPAVRLQPPKAGPMFYLLQKRRSPMVKTLLLAPAFALALALPARAMTDAKPTNQASRSTGLSAEVVEVQTRPSPVG